jgi:hypothetical protein
MSISVAVDAIVSVLLISLGVAVALDYRGLAARIADVIAGPTPMSDRINDRLWSILPLALGIGRAFGLVLETFVVWAAIVVGVASIGIYFAAMMRLAWLFTPPQRRRLGPLFWTMRAAAIPAAFFFAYAGLIAGVAAVEPHR